MLKRRFFHNSVTSFIHFCSFPGILILLQRSFLRVLFLRDQRRGFDDYNQPQWSLQTLNLTPDIPVCLMSNGLGKSVSKRFRFKLARDGRFFLSDLIVNSKWLKTRWLHFLWNCNFCNILVHQNRILKRKSTLHSSDGNLRALMKRCALHRRKRHQISHIVYYISVFIWPSTHLFLTKSIPFDRTTDVY